MPGVQFAQALVLALSDEVAPFRARYLVGVPCRHCHTNRVQPECQKRFASAGSNPIILTALCVTAKPTLQLSARLLDYGPPNFSRQTSNCKKVRRLRCANHSPDGGGLRGE